MSTFHAYVDAAHFHEALGNVLRFAAKRSRLPILEEAQVRFEDGHCVLTCTNLLQNSPCLVKTPTATRSELVSAGRLTAWVTLSAVLFPSGGHGTAIRQWLWRVDLPLKP